MSYVQPIIRAPEELLRQQGGVLRLFREGEISLNGPNKARCFALGWRKNPKHLLEREYYLYSRSTMLPVGLEFLAHAARKMKPRVIILNPTCGPEAPGRWLVLAQNDPELAGIEVRF